MLNTVPEPHQPQAKSGGGPVSALCEGDTEAQASRLAHAQINDTKSLSQRA